MANEASGKPEVHPHAAKAPAATAAGARPTPSEHEPAAAGKDQTLARAAARAAKLG